ncbi:outer membrane beta-barrel protein, partial [Xanthovirga aplysinae]|uniref:outer membrane beta-barrel protein n=1 Tax=Xanthovirga aplysinae TaxID=2529853 RepID=UPI0012BD57E0
MNTALSIPVKFRRIYFLIFFLFISIAASAQSGNKVIISGKVTDVSNHPLEFTNVSLLQDGDSSLVTGMVTDFNGKFQLSALQGNYILNISFIGYAPYSKPFVLKGESLDLGTIILNDDDKTLEEVVVQGQKAMIERTAEGIVYNVENSPTAAGSNAWEALSKTPGVMVDKDGNINIAGKQGTSIMLDGKRVNLSGEELKGLLESMSAEDLSKIEAITQPSAKYDAQGTGGIINIKRKRNKTYGLKGSVNGAFQQATYGSYNGGLNLNYRNKRWDIFGKYNGRSYKYKSTNDITTILKDYASHIDLVVLSPGNSHHFEGGMDYYLNEKTSIGWQAEGNLRAGQGLLLTKTKEGDNFLNIPAELNSTEQDNDTQMGSFNLHFKKEFDSLGRALNVDIDYFKYQSDQLQDLFREGVENGEQNLHQPLTQNKLVQDFINKSAKIDYTHPIGKGKLETGVKLSSNLNDNIVDYGNWVEEELVKDENQSDHFIYQEDIQALYASYGTALNARWMLQAGLRSEFTQTVQQSIALNSTTKNNYVNI